SNELGHTQPSRLASAASAAAVARSESNARCTMMVPDQIEPYGWPSRDNAGDEENKAHEKVRDRRSTCRDPPSWSPTGSLVSIARQAQVAGDMVTSTNETRSQRSGRGNRPKGEGAALIAAAARQAFAEQGYHGVSIRDLAQRADVSLSTMYWFYPSKQDLLFALIQESVRAFAEIYAAALATADDDPVSRLDAYVGALIEYRARYQLES